MTTPSTLPVIVAVTGEDARFDTVRSRASALAAGGNATVILYDLDAAGLFASPVPTGWSGDGEAELMDQEARGGRLDVDALETAGRGSLARQVRSLRAVGIDAWGWLPTSKDAASLEAYATDQDAALVVAHADMRPADGGRLPFEIIEP